MGGVDRRFRALVSAYAVSAYGNYLNLIALSLFSYEVTGSAFGVGVVMALRLGSGCAAGLVAGASAGRAGRRAVMICADLGQGAVMAALAVAGTDSPVWLLAGAVVVLGAGNTFFTVSLRSAIPVMVGHDARARANGLLVAARSLATVLGFASAAPVIALGGYGIAFAVNGASFAVSAVALLTLRPRTEDSDGGARSAGGAGSDAPGAADAQTAGPGAGGRGAAGLSGLLLGLVVLRGVDALASASHNVALPVVAHTVEPGGPAVFMTRFWVAWAVGTVLAHLVLRNRRGEGAWGERAFAIGTCAMSLSFVTAFLGLPAAGLMAAAACAGFADGWTEIVYVSRLQAAPDRQRGRLFGLSATAEQCGFALGGVSAAAALESLPARIVVAAFHGTALCGALVLLLTTGRHGPARSRSAKSGEQGKGGHGTRTGPSSLPGS